MNRALSTSRILALSLLLAVGMASPAAAGLFSLDGDDSGTAGEPSKASPEGGKRYHEHLVKRLVEVIEMLQKS